MKKVMSLLLALTMAFSLAACGSGKGTETAADSKGEETTAAEDTTAEDTAAETVERGSLNVAYMPNYASMWGLMSAKDGGYFDEEGLDVTFYEFADGPTEISSMESRVFFLLNSFLYLPSNLFTN